MNPYDILQVSPAADDQVIRAAYRSLIQRYHPDRHPGNADMAQVAASLTQAYELLADPSRKAALDASLKAAAARSQAAQTASTHRAPRSQDATQATRTSSASKTWALPVAGLILCVGLAWALGSYASKRWMSLPPAQQLANIRTQMENPQTSEAERRVLFERKLDLLEKHAELAPPERLLRINDLAARSVALLDEPLVFSPAASLSLGLPLARLVVPEITLILGSFDTGLVNAQIQKHRQRIVAELSLKLNSEPIPMVAGADDEVRLKKLIRDSVIISLDMSPQEKYPSTYFESPGRHGVIDVILPQSFGVLR